MDCKIINKLFLILIIFTSTQLNAVEFKGKFLQGHYIVGLTDPSAEILIDKKKEVTIFKDEVIVLTQDNTQISAEYAEYDKKNGGREHG